jgi:alpha-mannosidase
MHWKETLVKVEFNTVVETDKVAADIPYAVIERSTHPKVEWDKARTEMPVQKWSDLSGKDAGVALINFGKYGFSLNDDGAGWRLSIIKAAVYAKPRLGDHGVNVLYETLMRLHTDQGEHWANMALFPHAGGWAEGKVNKAAYEYNTPAIARRINAGKGDLPDSASLITIDSPSAYIASVKKAEDDDSLVVRVVEGDGKDTSAVLKVYPGFKIADAAETNLLELDPKPVKHDDKSASFPVGHFEIKTIKLRLNK